MAFSHHSEGIDKITEILSKREDVLAVIMGGSIAHKTEREDSDIDLMIVISKEDYEKREKENDTWYGNTVTAQGKDIFVDAKYISPEFIKEVIDKGAEPIRFAFHGAYATYSKIDGLDKLIQEASRFPLSKKEENIARFYAQLKAWEWYSKEGLKRSDMYLLRHSANKLILFAGRLILAHNEILFPYHKWFLTALENAEKKPEGFVGMCRDLLEDPTEENIDLLFNATEKFMAQWYKQKEDWPNTFLKDSELVWREGKQPIDEL